MTRCARVLSRRTVQVSLAGGALLVVLVYAGVVGSTPRATADGAPLPYRDTSLPFSVRAADLVSRMTMEEKLDQFRAMQPHSTFAAKPTAITRLGVKPYGYWSEANHGIYFPTISGNSNYTQYPQKHRDRLDVGH